MLKIVNTFKYFVGTKEGIASRITVTSFTDLQQAMLSFLPVKYYQDYD